MGDNISYDYLWEAYQKEKLTNQLLLVPKTFYTDVGKFLDNINANPNSATMKDNAITLANDFFEKRKQKILIYIAYNKQLPQPVSDNELEFYNRISQIVKAEKLDLASNPKAKPTLKSIRDIPEIILPSGSKIGPLKKDQIIELLNDQDRAYLTENAICEIY